MLTANDLNAKAWELMPRYAEDTNSKSVRDAIKDGVGTCMHRSRVIGREALNAGMASMRRITFGADTLPCHFSNYVLIGNSWVHISTGRKVQNVNVGNHGYNLDVLKTYAAFGSLGISELEPGCQARAASVIVIAETSMPLYSECVAASQYLRVAVNLVNSHQESQG